MKSFAGRLGVLFGTLVLASLPADAAPAKPEVITLTAEQIEKTATLTRGDLVLYRPADPKAIQAPGPLLAFTPISSEDELRIPFTVKVDGYYNIQSQHIQAPQGDLYDCFVDGQPTGGRVGCRWGTVLVRRLHWGHMRLRPGEHVLQLRRSPTSRLHPLAIANITFTPGATRQFFAEAEWLPVVGRDADALRPPTGTRYLSGFGELRLPGDKPDDAVTLTLPAAPPTPTHLAVALVGGPDRGIAKLALDGRSIKGQHDTFAPKAGRPTQLVIVPLDRRGKAPTRLTIASAGKNEKSSGSAIGIDGVAFGQEGVIEAEWMVWGPDWGPTPLPYATNSGRASDRGYIAGHAQAAAKPMTGTVHLPWTGSFKLQVRVCKASGQGKCQFQFDDRRFPRVIDFHAARHAWPKEWETLGTVNLKPGQHTLRVWWKDTDPKRRTIRLDAIRFVPVRRSAGLDEHALSGSSLSSVGRFDDGKIRQGAEQGTTTER